jgi:hypothetical protein
VDVSNRVKAHINIKEDLKTLAQRFLTTFVKLMKITDLYRVAI